MKVLQNRRLRSFIKYFFLVLVLYYVSRFMVKSIGDMQNLKLQVNPQYLVLAFFFHFLYLVSRASVWHYITYLNKVHISYRQAVYVWFLSLLGKFIPGKIFYLGARVYHYRNYQKSGALVSYSFFIEFMTSITASILIFIISFSFIPKTSFHYLRYVGIIITFFILMALNPFILNKVIAFINRYRKRAFPLLRDITYDKILKVTGLYVCSWLLLGLGFFMMVNSIYPLPLKDLLYTTGAFALATDIGILALFAPSGIGVREAVIIATMSKLVPAGMASIISILARLWATSSELFWIGVIFLTGKPGGLAGLPSAAASDETLTEL